MKLGFAVSLVLVLLASRAAADDYFVDSDDFEEREEIVNTFLTEPDYRIMIEEIERNGVEFDWGWALTPGWGPVPGAESAVPQKGLKKVLGRFRRSGAGTVQEPRQLGFDLSSFTTVYLEPVVNSIGIVDRNLQPAIAEYFAQALEGLGLQVVDAPDAADLTLGLAIVDLNATVTHVPVYNIRIEPFIELELRLRDRRRQQDLLLLRNQAHSATPPEAALRYANLLVQFLR